MRLPFEEWLQDQTLPTPAKELFSEAIICYKASAYRAALLLSYLGFQTTVRDRVLRGRQPSNLSDTQWNKIQSDVRNDDTWDSAIYDAIQQRPPRHVFALNEDLRNQITYFKNRRNDCAHGKSNKIDYTHVESFWLFVRSNLSKFVVNESREDLINRIRDHFDRSITPPGEDYLHLAGEIPSAVDHDKLIQFFDELHQIFSGLPSVPYAKYPQKEVEFYNSIFDLQDEGSSLRLIEYLKGNENLLAGVIRLRPERVILFRDDPSLIRKLWYDKLFAMIGFERDLLVYCAMLTNNLIPVTQQAEANELVISRLAGQMPAQSSHEVLEAHSFFGTLKALAFENGLISRFSWANSNCALVVYYLYHFQIDTVIAKSLSDTFTYSNYPYELQKALNTFFLNNRPKLKEFEEALQGLKLPYPPMLEQPLEF